MKSKGSKVGLKSQGKSMKVQGTKPSTGSMSDKRQKPDPTHLERREGSEFANAVKAVIQESKDMKGSASSFLGVDKQILDPKQFVDGLFLSPKGK